MTDESLTALRDRLCEAAVENVAFDGWSMRALRDGAQQAGVSFAETRWAFPRGAPDLVAHYLDWSDRRLAEALEDAPLDGMRVRDRVAYGVRAKLEAESGRKEAVRLALAHLMTPGRQGGALRALYRTVDLIWRAAGDRATDHNFYTKRGLLAGVYVATLLFWLRDRSEDHAETWRFLDARIDNALTAGKTAGQALSRLSAVLDGAQLLHTLREGLSSLAAPAAGWRR